MDGLKFGGTFIIISGLMTTRHSEDVNGNIIPGENSEMKMLNGVWDLQTARASLFLGDTSSYHAIIWNNLENEFLIGWTVVISINLS